MDFARESEEEEKKMEGDFFPRSVDRNAALLKNEGKKKDELIFRVKGHLGLQTILKGSIWPKNNKRSHSGY